jgi:hypothetical protein
LLLSYIAYLKAKNAPITKPGIATISVIPIKNDKKIAKIPQLSEPIISIIIADFVAAKSNLLLVCPYSYKSYFLYACSKGIKRDWDQIRIKEDYSADSSCGEPCVCHQLSASRSERGQS